jgi:hypothetical protein
MSEFTKDFNALRITKITSRITEKSRDNDSSDGDSSDGDSSNGDSSNGDGSEGMVLESKSVSECDRKTASLLYNSLLRDKDILHMLLVSLFKRTNPDQQLEQKHILELGDLAYDLTYSEEKLDGIKARIREVGLIINSKLIQYQKLTGLPCSCGCK